MQKNSQNGFKNRGKTMSKVLIMTPNSLTKRKIVFTPLEKRILTMALVDDDKLCSFYAKEIFEHINLADVIRKQIRIKLSILLEVEYDYVKKIVFYTDDRVIIKKNGKKATIGIYRLDVNFKAKIRQLIEPEKKTLQQNS